MNTLLHLAIPRLMAVFLALELLSPEVEANPAGGQVTGGSANINTSPGNVTVKQLSNQAIINWKSFSIRNGETTSFIQPSSSSTILNRVTGGSTSVINGNLTANGQVYLINGNGILVGPKGMINTNGFTASTRNITDTDLIWYYWMRVE